MALERDQIQRLFTALDGWTPDQFPARMALSQLLNESLKTKESAMLSEQQAVLFATAAVEMWQRAVHSLITAMAIRTSSEIWACVSGYYASHYSVRAFAHLFGYFSLYFQRRLFIELSPWGPRYQCRTVDPHRARKEHQFYWTQIKKLPEFAGDPLFTNNDDRVPLSDASHRGFASYMDHLNRFVQHEVLDRDQVRRGIIDLAYTALEGEATISIPNRERYPDVGTVLSVAYLRIYKFREYLDDLLPTGGRFWIRHRTPPWCTDLLSFPARRD